ncbi:117aa long hypothetical protein [Pyrococcus horikoshii OT3]|uniref:Uncharacterized protein n=1 Tax=Pyrococcus horikoshii (strain ATCC 700860 / DSM 12428 / JCM 9974 / NBRC 100139 / OT-3) TaxID=70601 RepID=O59624_PYRHO|nr:117aa long hypothetical protein [Pyrococcus horikoshii OT3]
MTTFPFSTRSSGTFSPKSSLNSPAWGVKTISLPLRMSLNSAIILSPSASTTIGFSTLSMIPLTNSFVSSLTPIPGPMTIASTFSTSSSALLICSGVKFKPSTSLTIRSGSFTLLAAF